VIHAITPQQSYGHIVGSTRPWVATAKNFLFNRMTQWRDPILQTATIYHIAQAFFFFIGGSFFLALISLGAGLLFAKTVADLRQFADLNKGIKDIREEGKIYGLENIQFKKSNIELEKKIEKLDSSIENLKGEVDRLTEVREKFEESHKRYERINDKHEAIVKELGETTERLVTGIEGALTSGNEVSQEILTGFLKAAKNLKLHKQNLETITSKLEKGNSKALEEFRSVMADVKKLNYRGVRDLNEAYAELTAVKAELAEKRKRLEIVTKKLEGATLRIDNSTRKLEATVDAAVDSGFIHLKTHLYSQPAGPTMTALWIWASIGVISSARFLFQRVMGS
jgi:predicted nuclease with TOPRIM domain